MTFQNVPKGGILIRLDWGQLVALVEVEDDVLDVGLTNRLSGEHRFILIQKHDHIFGVSKAFVEKNLKKSASTMSALTILRSGITSSKRPNLK